MACQIEKMGKNEICVCDTTAEAAECVSALDRADDTGIFNAVANFGMDVAGGIKDAAYGLAMFGPDVARYVARSDKELGQRLSWSVGRYLDLDNNIFHFEPAAAFADTVNSIGYGGFDMLLGHAPNYIVNDLLGLNFRYFHPQPQNVRGFVAELVTVGGMMAGGQVIKVLKGEPVVLHKASPVASLKEDIGAVSKAAKEAQRALSEPGCSEAGFVDMSWLYRIFSKKNKGNTISTQGQPTLHISWEYSAAGVESFMQKVTDNLVKKGVEGDRKALGSAGDMAAKYPQTFNREHVSALVKALKEDGDSQYKFEIIYYVLSPLAEARPELFSWEHMEPLMVSTRRSRSTLYVMDKLAGSRPQLFSVDDVDVVAKVAATQEPGYYYGPRPTIENIVNLKMNIVDIMIRNTTNGSYVVSDLIKLANKRPVIIPQVVSGLLEKGVDHCYWPLASFAKHFSPELFPADLVAKMIDAAKQGNIDASVALGRLAQNGSSLTPQIVDGLIDILRAKVRDNSALGDLVRSNPELLSADQIASLIDIAKADGDGFWMLNVLVEQRPELAPQIIPALTEAAKTNKSAQEALFFLGEEKPELFK